MRNQITLALDNLEAVLNAADMGLTNITRLNIYTTDVDEALQHFDVFGARVGPVEAVPTATSSTTPNANQAGITSSASAATPNGTTTNGTNSGTLPRTGYSPGLLLALGSVLVAAGALVLGTRRRLSRVNASLADRVR